MKIFDQVTQRAPGRNAGVCCLVLTLLGLAPFLCASDSSKPAKALSVAEPKQATSSCCAVPQPPNAAAKAAAAERASCSCDGITPVARQESPARPSGKQQSSCCGSLSTPIASSGDKALPGLSAVSNDLTLPAQQSNLRPPDIAAHFPEVSQVFGGMMRRNA